jgi:hypothetical protein
MRSGRHDRAALPDAFQGFVQAILKAAVNAVPTQSRGLIKIFRLRSMVGCFALNHIAAQEFAALEFESANSTIVKSIKQRDLLNTWLRLYARGQSLPRVEEYQPSRIEDELPDLVFFAIASTQPPRLIIESDGTRMSRAYGHSGKGRSLEEYLGTRLAPLVMPIYHECLTRALPVYTISNVDDSYGRIVAYERLLLPFSNGVGVTKIIASLKTICEDGNFEIKNLMRGNDALPTAKLCTVIDRDLFHRAPGRIPAGDVIEFSDQPYDSIVELI